MISIPDAGQLSRSQKSTLLCTPYPWSGHAQPGLHLTHLFCNSSSAPPPWSRRGSCIASISVSDKVTKRFSHINHRVVTRRFPSTLETSLSRSVSLATGYRGVGFDRIRGNGLKEDCCWRQLLRLSVSESVSQSVSQPASQWVSQSLSQSLSQSPSQSVSQSFSQWVSQVTSQSVS